MPRKPQALLENEKRILEAIVTTSNEDGTVNIAPMGAVVDDSLEQFMLRPFRSSTTYQNLHRTRTGVLHITDDVLLFAQAAIGKLDFEPKFLPDEPLVLASVCRWFRFEIKTIDDSAERSLIMAEATQQGHLREFFGFNRAKHAVLEAAILATRVHLLPADEILAEFARWESPLRKTGGSQEIVAFGILQEYVRQQLTVPTNAGNQES